MPCRAQVLETSGGSGIRQYAFRLPRRFTRRSFLPTAPRTPAGFWVVWSVDLVFG
uniref:Uncharacterized protein n=1 Tax=Oryza rufipogon TaxID=4529 RepID=A0A0E0QGA2_ORYRU